MKTRKGFVSNSSTTSFVILGFKIDLSHIEDEEKREEIEEDLRNDFTYIDKYEYSKLKKNELILGVSMMDIDGPVKEIGLNEYEKHYEKFLKNKMLKKHKIEIPPLSECKIYGGTIGD